MKAWLLSQRSLSRLSTGPLHCRHYATRTAPTFNGKEPLAPCINDNEVESLDFSISEAGQGYGVDQSIPEVDVNSRDGVEYGLEEPDLRPEDVEPPFAKAFIKVDDDVRTHRTREYGNRALPLPPVIDPVFVAIRNRWKMRKEAPTKIDDLTPFQKAFNENPYGMCIFVSQV